MIERRNRCGADRGVAAQEIGHADRDAGVCRRPRNERRRDPWVHRIAGRVGNADHRIAVAVGARGHAFDKIERVRPEEKADLHGGSYGAVTTSLLLSIGCVTWPSSVSTSTQMPSCSGLSVKR